MNTVKEHLILYVVDIYKQKDLPEYRGIVRLTVDNGTEHPDEFYEMTVTLPKVNVSKHTLKLNYNYTVRVLVRSFKKHVLPCRFHSCCQLSIASWTERNRLLEENI